MSQVVNGINHHLVDLTGKILQRSKEGTEPTGLALELTQMCLVYKLLADMPLP